jgi:virulence-associated protein VapD
MFVDILKEKKALILKNWQNRIYESYHPDARKFLEGEKDRFNNPVGACIKRETEALLNGLIENAEAVKLIESMDNFVRVRSVQDFTASQAVNFMFLLKNVLKEACAEELQESEIMKELIDFEIRIDRLTFLAFDVYMNCREQINRIRLKEVKNRSAVLFEKAQRESNRDENNNNPNGGVG